MLGSTVVVGVAARDGLVEAACGTHVKFLMCRLLVKHEGYLPGCNRFDRG